MVKAVGKEAIALEPEKQSAFVKAVKTIKKINKKFEEKKEEKNLRYRRGIILVNHVPHGFFEKEMRKFFTQFGKVLRLRIARSKKTGRCKGYAFVEFEFEEVAKIAAETMDNYLMFERLIKCQLLSTDVDAGKIFANRYISEQNYPRQKNRDKLKKLQKTEKTEKQQQTIMERRIQNLNKRNNKLVELGIDYQYDVNMEEDVGIQDNVVVEVIKTKPGVLTAVTPKYSKKRVTPVATPKGVTPLKKTVTPVATPKQVGTPSNGVATPKGVTPLKKAVTPVATPKQVGTPSNRVATPKGVTPLKKVVAPVATPKQFGTPSNRVATPKQTATPSNKIVMPKRATTPTNKIATPKKVTTPKQVATPSLKSVTPSTTPKQVVTPLSKVATPKQVVVTPLSKPETPKEGLTLSKKATKRLSNLALEEIEEDETDSKALKVEKKKKTPAKLLKFSPKMLRSRKSDVSALKEAKEHSPETTKDSPKVPRGRNKSATQGKKKTPEKPKFSPKMLRSRKSDTSGFSVMPNALGKKSPKTAKGRKSMK